MIRKQAMQQIIDSIGNEIIVSANGFISRDLYSVLDFKKNLFKL